MLCTHSTTNHPPVHARCCSYLPPCSRCNRGYVGCGPLQTSTESRVHFTWTVKICKNNLPVGRFLLEKRHKFYTLGRSRFCFCEFKDSGQITMISKFEVRYFSGDSLTTKAYGVIFAEVAFCWVRKNIGFVGELPEIYHTMHFASFCIV